MYGHINNVVYYSYMDTAVNNMLIARGILDLQGDGPICVVAETGMQFFDATLSYPDVIEASARVAAPAAAWRRAAHLSATLPPSSHFAAQVGLRATKIGKSSIVYSVGIFKQGAATSAAVGRFVHVNVDRASLRPTALAPPALAALEALR